MKRPACTARSARCLKRTQGAKDCTASNAAIRRRWTWRVSHIALSGWSTSPPHGPTDPWTRAHAAQPTCRLRGADLDRTTVHTHATTARGDAGRNPCPRTWARIQARERWRGERNRQTPGDHATNLGATMLVLLNWLRRPILRGRTRRAVTQRAHGFSLYKMHSL